MASHMEILVPEVGSYLEGFTCMCEVAQSLCSSGEVSETPSLKLVNLVTTIYQLIININIIFLNCLQMRYTFCTFFLSTIINLVGKVTMSASVRKINFPAISEQTSLIVELLIDQSFTYVFLF